MSRLIEILVEDVNGQPIWGANITFTVDGTPAGEVIGSYGRASIEIPANATLHVEASLGNIKQDATVARATMTAPKTVSHRFQFAKVPSLVVPAAPEARCPDGSTGRPCVKCLINGKTVTVCA
jgi:hypothetical protein